MSIPYEGDSSVTNTPGITGSNTATSDTVIAIGVKGVSTTGEGVHGDTNSQTAAGVAGISLNTGGTGAGVYGESRGHGAAIVGHNAGDGEGVHGDTNSQTVAGVAGISLNPGGTGAGVYGESRGHGAGVVGHNPGGLAGLFEGNVTITGHLNADKSTITCFDVALTGGDCAEEFELSTVDQAQPGCVVSFDECGMLTLSRKAYDKSVAGVLSGAGDYYISQGYFWAGDKVMRTAPH